MNQKLALPAALAAFVTAMAGLSGVATATEAGTPAKSRITINPSDSNPDVGEQFVLRGRMTSLGHPVAGVRVRVQTYRDGGWVQLKGATVSTDVDGRYRVRVVLGQDGDRDLRVVGNPAGDDIRTARGYTVVRVWK